MAVGDGRARDGWQYRMSGESILWCDGCGLPLLRARCGRCGQEGRAVMLSPPGDVRPAMREGLALLASVLGRQFRMPGDFRLPEIVLFNHIAGLDRSDQIIIDGRLFGTLSFDPVLREYFLQLTGAGASMLLNAGAAHLRFSGQSRGHVKGKTLPLQALTRIAARPPDPPAGTAAVDWARPGNEVIVASGDQVAVGRLLDGRAGVRIRDIAPRGIRFSGLKATLDNAVSANREALEALENIAVHEIGAAASDHPGLALTVSFSGGKDSLVALELACRTGRKLSMLFSNTGLEFPETVAHVRATARERNLRLIEGGAGEAFWENLPRFGLPAKDFRWCCKVCKLAPMTSLLAGHFRTGVLTVEGRRRRESFNRQRLRMLEESPFVIGQLNIEPIRDWTALEVWLYIRLRHLPYNPLYDADIERVGCWMCPATLESEFETLKKTHPSLALRWTEKLAEEGAKAGMDERAVSAGAWRWKAQPPKMMELAARYRWKPPGARPGEPGLSVAGGISPCLTGGFSLEANLTLPKQVPFERVANLLGTLGEVRYSEDMGVAIVRRGPVSAKLFESGQIVVTGPRTDTVRPFLRELVGVVLRASQCTKCNLCEKACRKNALVVRESPEVDLERCDQCGKCARSCVLVRYADKLVAGTG